MSHLLNSPFGEPRDDLRTYIFGFSAVESKAPTLDRSIKEFVRERRCARTGRLTFEFASFGGRKRHLVVAIVSVFDFLKLRDGCNGRINARKRAAAAFLLS